MDLPACVAPAGFSTLIPSPSFEHDQTLFWLDMGADILWRSSDDGASWQEIFRAPGNYGHLEDLSFPPPSSGMRHGGYLRYTLRAAPFTYEFLSRTLDLGAAWQEQVSCGSHCVGDGQRGSSSAATVGAVRICRDALSFYRRRG